MSLYSDDALNKMYENKRDGSAKRGIDFNLSKDYYVALYKNRCNLTCAYTGRKFITNKGCDHNDYPTLERIDHSKPYELGNICFVTKFANHIKSLYIENNTSRKGLSGGTVTVINLIEKAINNPNAFNAKLEVYQEIYEKSLERQQELKDREENLNKKLAIDKVQAKLKEQQMMSQHYLDITKALGTMNLVCNISFKEFRDKFRVKKDQLTGKPFEAYNDKFLWIPNQEEVIAKGIIEVKDFVVVHLETQTMVDNLRKSGNMKTLMLNTLKHL